MTCKKEDQSICLVWHGLQQRLKATQTPQHFAFNFQGLWESKIKAGEKVCLGPHRKDDRLNSKTSFSNVLNSTASSPFINLCLCSCKKTRQNNPGLESTKAWIFSTGCEWYHFQSGAKCTFIWFWCYHPGRMISVIATYCLNFVKWLLCWNDMQIS